MVHLGEAFFCIGFVRVLHTLCYNLQSYFVDTLLQEFQILLQCKSTTL